MQVPDAILRRARPRLGPLTQRACGEDLAIVGIARLGVQAGSFRAILVGSLGRERTLVAIPV